MRHAAHRPCDLVARYGGEEFAVLLPDTSQAGACHVAENMLLVVESLKLPHAASPVADHVTLTLGVAVVRPRADGIPGADSRFGGLSTAGSSAELLTTADEALYAAKRAGRGRAYCLADDEEPFMIVPPVRRPFDVTTIP
jgi:diguanylate cyclase (GGDEF)-like protein